MDSLTKSKPSEIRSAIIGYVRIDRLGDLDPEDECCWEDCQNTLENGAYMMFLESGDIFGPVCSICASSD